MNVTEIESELDTMARAMGEKGLTKPTPQLWLKANSGSHMWIEWGGANGYKAFRDGDIAEQIAAVHAWIASLPAPEETHRNEFMKLAAFAADYGRKHGIAAEFVNPLVEAMKRLSENALTDQREVAK